MVSFEEDLKIRSSCRTGRADLYGGTIRHRQAQNFLGARYSLWPFPAAASSLQTTAVIDVYGEGSSKLAAGNVCPAGVMTDVPSAHHQNQLVPPPMNMATS